MPLASPGCRRRWWLSWLACVAAASMGLSIETRSPVALVPLALLAIPAAAYVALAIDPAVLLTLGSS